MIAAIRYRYYARRLKSAERKVRNRAIFALLMITLIVLLAIWIFFAVVHHDASIDIGSFAMCSMTIFLLTGFNYQEFKAEVQKSRGLGIYMRVTEILIGCGGLAIFILVLVYIATHGMYHR